MIILVMIAFSFLGIEACTILLARSYALLPATTYALRSSCRENSTPYRMCTTALPSLNHIETALDPSIAVVLEEERRSSAVLGTVRPAVVEVGRSLPAVAGADRTGAVRHTGQVVVRRSRLVGRRRTGLGVVLLEVAFRTLLVRLVVVDRPCLAAYASSRPWCRSWGRWRRE